VPNPTAWDVEATRAAAGRPVALVSVPDEGVPRAPLKSTGAPALSVLTASAVAIPVPRPLTPVDIGNPVALVSVPEDGVPSTGVVNVGEVRVLLVRVSVPSNVAN
jgi:hypothetical protein